jgi:Na+/proline symporter
MLFFLATQSLWVSATILVMVTTLVAILGPIVVRRFVLLEKLSSNNEVAGFKFATVGVLYAVLLAFAIIVVWEKFSSAEGIVAQEAGAAETIFRLSHGIDDEMGAELRDALGKYLAIAVAIDWPAMNRGTMGEQTRPARQALDNVYSSLLKVVGMQHVSAVLVSEIMRQLDIIAQARRARLIASEGTVPGVIWALLFGGAVLTIAFTFFFGTRSLSAQTVMTGILSILIFSELLAIVAIDRPFSGAVKVEPHSLTNILELYTNRPNDEPRR